MIVFYNSVWSDYVHHYKKHPYIYYLPNVPVLIYDSQLISSAKTTGDEKKLPSDYSDLLSVFVANNLGNLAGPSTLRYPPYSGRRFQYYYG
jgi:hypothetical protein